MFCSTEGQPFIPFGRSVYECHPDIYDTNSKFTNEIEIVESFKQINLHETKELWHVRKNYEILDGHTEELYVKDKIVVWSKGVSPHFSEVISTFSLESPVLEAVWCVFSSPIYEYNENNKLIGNNASGYLQTERCIGIIEKNRDASFYFENGKDYTFTIPFNVKKIWQIKNCIFIERTQKIMEDLQSQNKSSENQELSILFSLSHPLNELVPVIIKTEHSKIEFLTEPSKQIVFVGDDPSILLLYDHNAKTHSLWGIRWVNNQEKEMLNFPFQFWDTTQMDCTIESNNTQTPRQNPLNNSKFTLSSIPPSLEYSPFRNLSSRLSNTMFNKAFNESPIILKNNIINTSRPQSPNSTSNSNLFNRLNLSNASTNNTGVLNMSKNATRIIPESLVPETCLEHLWTEPHKKDSGEGTKAFVTSDLTNKRYICWLVKGCDELRCLKYKVKNDQSNFEFGVLSIISAKDAIPMKNLQMMLILDTKNILVLYSGLVKLSLVHVPSLDIRFRNSCGHDESHQGPLTSSRPTSAMGTLNDDEVRMLSPVLQKVLMVDDALNQPSSSILDSFAPYQCISSLIEHVDEKFILELNDGSMFSTSLPPITTCPIITQCLKAIRYILPKKLSLKFIGQWYILHNSPGCVGGMSEWQQFEHCLLSMIGITSHNNSNLSENKSNNSSHIIHEKKFKLSSSGTNQDSLDLMKTESYQKMKNKLFSQGILGKFQSPDIVHKIFEVKKFNVDSNGLIFSYTYVIILALHLVYEDIKLDIIDKGGLIDLASLLFCLTRDLKFFNYTDYYFRDLPEIVQKSKSVLYNFTADDIEKLNTAPHLPIMPPNVMQWLLMFMRSHPYLEEFLYIPGITLRIEYIFTIYTLHMKKIPEVGTISKFRINSSIKKNEQMNCSLQKFKVNSDLLQYLLKIDNKISGRIELSLMMPAIDSLHENRSDPPNNLSEAAYKLIGREDLAKQCNTNWEEIYTEDHEFNENLNDVATKIEDDGMSNLDHQLIKLRFDKDLRVKEIKRLLQSSRPVRVAIKQRPEVSDHEFIEERESYLYAISIRTMALPIGRGMLMLSTFNPIPTETLHIPKLCLSGRVPPKWNVVEMTHIELPPNLTDWPQFHNGVAAGLKISSSSQLESSWILFNKQRSNTLTNEHAGFLMGQGLNRHLSNLETLNVHDYLIKGHEMTNLGLLLGMSADKRGSMDISMTKVLSIHLPALLPPTSTELDLSHNIQVVAIFGTGLVYQGSAHRHIAEVLLAEIGRPPGPEMENNVDRESYSLAAGFALGNVMLAKGSEELGMNDIGMPDQLLHYMVGGQKRPLLEQQFRERYKVPSFQILEGDHVNTDVTSPGATMALALMFFNTNNASIAKWFVPPDTPHLLNLVRPDFLMLRAIAYGLIMWKSVEPTMTWIFSNIPPIGFNYAFQRQKFCDAAESNIDFDTMDQVFINIVTGCCFVIGLKFAGSANSKASSCLTDILIKILRLQKQLGNSSQKDNFNLYIATILLCLSMVMAGTGNLDVLRYCRRLRERIGPPTTYGFHMAISMSIGLLLLGGGKCTLSTKPEAIAAMLCAFFPKWPIHTNDNRFHLQAFRHIYALAVERRMLIPRDVASDKYCYAKLDIVFKDGKKMEIKAPYMLPELDLLELVAVKLPRYWPMKFQRNKNWNILEDILKGTNCLYVKQRAGYLSYSNDPQGFHGALTQSLARDQLFGKIFKASDIGSFTTDPFYLSLANAYCTIAHPKEFEDFQHYSQFLYDCISKEKFHIFNLEASLYNNMNNALIGKIAPFHLIHLKILSTFVNKFQNPSLLSEGFNIHLESMVETQLLQWAQDNGQILVDYIEGKNLIDITQSNEDLISLSRYLTYFEIPNPFVLKPLHSKKSSFPALYLALQESCLPSFTIKLLLDILQKKI